MLLLPGILAKRSSNGGESDAPNAGFFDYTVTIDEKPMRGLGVQLGDDFTITAFAPSSTLSDSGEVQIGDRLVSIVGQQTDSGITAAGGALTPNSNIRALLRDLEYPLEVTLRATVTADRTCVAPPKGGRLMVDIVGDSAPPVYFDYLAADFTTGDQLLSEPTEVCE